MAAQGCLLLFPEGPSTQYFRTLVPNTIIDSMVSRTRDLKCWLLGASGIVSCVAIRMTAVYLVTVKSTRFRIRTQILHYTHEVDDQRSTPGLQAVNILRIAGPYSGWTYGPIRGSCYALRRPSPPLSMRSVYRNLDRSSHALLPERPPHGRSDLSMTYA